MKTSIAVLRRHAPRLAAAILVVVLYSAARLPGLSDADRTTLASYFRFTRQPLPAVPEPPCKTVRAVHPSLEHISAWISSVGAGVALHDLDGDGYPNDVCYVDMCTDQVIVAPVPGTEKRKKPGTEVPYTFDTPFALDPTPLPYNPATMAPMGCLPGDINEDGLADILVYYWGRTPIAFLHTSTGELGQLHAHDYVPREVVPEGGRWYTNAATLADLDGDGHVDLMIGNYFPDGARILDAEATGTEAMQDSMSRAYNGGKKTLSAVD